MTFSKTTEYALRILGFMAASKDTMYSSNTLHKNLNIPKKYLQRILTILAKNKIIKSVKGKYGGYALARDSKKIFISEIIDVVEGFKNTPSCFFGFEKCALKNPCAMHNVWSKSQEDLIHILSRTKLSEISSNK